MIIYIQQTAEESQGFTFTRHINFVIDIVKRAVPVCIQEVGKFSFTNFPGKGNAFQGDIFRKTKLYDFVHTRSANIFIHIPIAGLVIHPLVPEKTDQSAVNDFSLMEETGGYIKRKTVLYELHGTGREGANGRCEIESGCCSLACCSGCSQKADADSQYLKCFFDH